MPRYVAEISVIVWPIVKAVTKRSIEEKLVRKNMTPNRKSR
jgi:hypothetical protein